MDFVVHLGDYICEAAQKPPPSQTPAADIGREVDPLHECVRLEDYRRRYAHYRRDPDVQALHAAHPMIATVDDHEFADGTWREGSVEHRPDRDGDWAQRRAEAFRARWEWLPARPPDPAGPARVFRTVPIGGLADLMLLDLRTRRGCPVPPPEMHDPGRTMLGGEQREWLLASCRGRRHCGGSSAPVGHVADLVQGAVAGGAPSCGGGQALRRIRSECRLRPVGRLSRRTRSPHAIPVRPRNPGRGRAER